MQCSEILAAIHPKSLSMDRCEKSTSNTIFDRVEQNNAAQVLHGVRI